MADNFANLMLEPLRHIRFRVDQIADDMIDLKHRMSSLESAMITVNHELAHGDETDALQQVTLDNLADRIQRIETRLDLLS